MGNSLAVECLIPEGLCRKGLKETDPASEGALLILLAGLGRPANFATYDVPTAAAWGVPKSGLWIAQHDCKIATEVLQAARAKAGHLTGNATTTDDLLIAVWFTSSSTLIPSLELLKMTVELGRGFSPSQVLVRVCRLQSTPRIHMTIHQCPCLFSGTCSPDTFTTQQTQ